MTKEQYEKANKLYQQKEKLKSFEKNKLDPSVVKKIKVEWAKNAAKTVAKNIAKEAGIAGVQAAAGLVADGTLAAQKAISKNEQWQRSTYPQGAQYANMMGQGATAMSGTGYDTKGKKTWEGKNKKDKQKELKKTEEELKNKKK